MAPRARLEIKDNMFIMTAFNENPDNCRVERHFLIKDYLGPDGMRLKEGQELIISHGDDRNAICEVLRDDHDLAFEDWQVEIPLNLIVCKTYEIKFVEEKRLG